jgi:hypothetical protein
MSKIQADCPICHSNSSEYHSIIAPWITELANLPLTPSKYFSCNNCSYSWFSRFSDNLVHSLYSKYRSESYYAVRHSWEPWFSKNDNKAFDETSSIKASNSVSGRKRDIEAIFDLSGLSLKQINGCLDFGGDSGQFIPNDIKGVKYVVDQQIASSYNVDSITYVSDIEVIEKKSLGLIMCCMVLEHVNDVNETIRDLVKLLSINGFLYIEVPMDSFRVSKFHQTWFYEKYLNFLSDHGYLFQLLDFATGVWRLSFKSIPFWGVLKQSEHINYFNYPTIQALLEKFGFISICKIENPKSRQGKLRFGKIQLLGEFRN